jgi:hypothetical protein
VFTFRLFLKYKIKNQKKKDRIFAFKNRKKTDHIALSSMLLPVHDFYRKWVTGIEAHVFLNAQAPFNFQKLCFVWEESRTKNFFVLCSGRKKSVFFLLLSRINELNSSSWFALKEAVKRYFLCFLRCVLLCEILYVMWQRSWLSFLNFFRFVCRIE